MDWQLHDALDTFPSCTGRWAELNERLFGGHPLLDPCFVAPLLEHFGGSGTRLAVLGDLDAPRAMMLIERARLGIWRTFLPSQAQIAPVLLARGDAPRIVDLLRALPARPVAFDLLAQDPHYSAVAPLGGPDELVEARPHVRTISVRLAGGFDQYWAGRSRRLVKNMRRYRHRLERDGVELRLEVAGQPDEVLARVQDYGRIESAGWKREIGTAVSPHNLQGRFYASMMRGFAQRGDARVYSLLHGDRVVSSRLVIRSRAMFVILKTTYDEHYAQYAPGRMLLQATLHDMFESGAVPVVEYYTNATAEQMAWATEDRWVCNVRFYRSVADRWGFERARSARDMVRRLVGHDDGGGQAIGGAARRGRPDGSR